MFTKLLSHPSNATEVQLVKNGEGNLSVLKIFDGIYRPNRPRKHWWHPPSFDKDGFRKNAKRELAVSQQCKHRAFVKVERLFLDVQGRSVIQMEYIEGDDDISSLSPTEILDATRELLEALSDAYKCGWFHRDLNPYNILIDRKQGNRLRLIDLEGFSQADDYPEVDKYFSSYIFNAIKNQFLIFLHPEDSNALSNELEKYKDSAAPLWVKTIASYQLKHPTQSYKLVG